jgi:hypothetical protein
MPSQAPTAAPSPSPSPAPTVPSTPSCGWVNTSVWTCGASAAPHGGSPTWSHGALHRSCADTAAWTNGAGPTCAKYVEEGWCRDGVVLQTWTTGDNWRNPELHCCACGGGTYSEPAPPVSDCQDAPDWTNGPSGLCCADYAAEGFCKGGTVLEHWAVGAAWNSPELSCCACGRQGA